MQIRLLADVLDNARPPESTFSTSPSHSTNLRVLRTFEHPKRNVRHFVDEYATLLDEVPILLGLEGEVEQFAAAYGLSMPSRCAERLQLPYDTWIQPERIRAIFRRRTFNAEDRLFATTHQSIECWMFIVLGALASAEASTEKQNYAQAAMAIEKATKIMTYLSGAIMILETLVLADYHPLRVRLRDASGAQSRQIADAMAACRRIGTQLSTDMQRRELSFLTMYQAPDVHPTEHAFAEALTTLEHRCALFLFNHYKLATRILGSGSLGSLGVEVGTLVSRFVEPMHPALDHARYRYNVFTSFAYGRHAGTMVSELERADPVSSRLPAAVDENRIREVTSAYFAAMETMDIDRWVALFSKSGTVESPIGSRPFRGHAGLRVMFRNFMKAFAPSMVATIRAVRIDAPRGYAEVDWQIDASHQKMPITYAGTECFQFTAAGEIAHVVVHDDPEEIALQMLSPSERRACLSQKT
ncbi:MAG: nuclear transport factor 2 family protein [Polyangiaceae bacterium]|nr:nuclear transport factor 2 family protein [Polyangiaceae bacterium]